MSTPMTNLSETVMKQKRHISFSGMNANQVRSQLTAQLDNKARMLEKVGISQISRNALIKHTDAIRKELKNLNRYDQEEELPIEIRTKLEDLANEFQYLKSSKSMLDDSISKAKIAQQTGLSPLLPPPPTNSSPTKQRSKAVNGNRRNPDIEFATEIGQGLLIEVRKLQSALQDKEEIIKQLELSKADNERVNETAQRHLKQREEIEERLKEENWDLEVANQELRTHLLESNQSVAKHNSDYGRLAKQLKSQSEQIDIMKAQEEKSASVIEAMKLRHEQETYHLRRHAASAQRENSQVQKQVEALNTELKIVQAKLAIKLATTSRATTDEKNQNEFKLEDKDDNDSENNQNKNTTPPATALPAATRSQQVMETETLKQSLAHAHRIISNLRSSYHKEKLEKFEIKKMLSDSQENIEQMRKEMASWNSNNAIPLGSNNHGGRAKVNGKKKPIATKKKRGGVARQPRGLCPNESDTDQQQQNKLEGEENDDEEEEEYDEYDSMDGDNNTLDQHFTNYGNSLGGILDFNNGGTTFASIAMKPLSSELEAKVQVIDAGINTDPVDYAVSTCVHGIIGGESTTEAVIQQDSNTRSNSFVAQEQHNQEVTHKNSVTQLLLHQQISEANNNKQINHNILSSVSQITTLLDKDVTSSSPTTAVNNEEYVQEQVEKALIKERKDIAERAGTILSPEQIETILLVTAVAASSAPSVNNALSSPTNNNNITSTTTNNIIPDVDHVKINNNNNIPTTTTTTNEIMIPQNQVDQLIQNALEKETATMVTKSNVEKMIQEAITSEQEKVVSLNLIPKVEAEKLVQEAITSEQEKVLSLNLIPKVEADKLVQEAIRSEQEKILSSNLIPKIEADKLVQEAIRSEQEKILSSNLIPKIEAEKMVAETLEEVTKKMKADAEILVQETRQELNAQFKTTEKELLRDMIPKAEAEALALAAVALANEKVKKGMDEEAADASTILNNIFPPVTEEMITKKKAEELVKLATASEQVKVQQALEKQKADIEAATLQVHQKLLADHLEQQKLKMEALKQYELEKRLAELEIVKQAALEKQKADIEVIKQAELEKHLAALETIKEAALEKQKADIEAAKQFEMEKQRLEVEISVRAELEKHKADIEASKKAELEKQKADIELAKQVEWEKKKSDIESAKQAELEKQRLDVEASVRAELEKQIAEIEAAKQFELEKVKEESNAAKLAELVIITKSIEAYKKECEETNQRMVTMLTKDSADVLVKRAVADALEKVENNQAEVLAGMMSREYALLMVNDEVAKALDLERKEVAEREETEAIEMISKAEAEALAKVAAADAIVKERQAMAARENELVTKEEAEVLATTAVREAVDKERSESTFILARERKLLREKEERMISKEEAEQNTKEAVRLALLEKKETKKLPELTTSSHLNIAPNDEHPLETPVPTRFMGEPSSTSNIKQRQGLLPSTAIERSVSTSRLALPSLNISPSPSISTPASSSSSRKLRLSNSVSSLRLGSGRKENNIQKSQRPSTDSAAPSNVSFGSFRILENSKYASRLQSKSSISLRELSNRHGSVTSISTMSIDDAHQNQGTSRMHMPMNSEDSFPGFSSGGGTDMYVISAITQTMIGEWMSKHTRRYVGGGISENKHQRFFWVHPYTKILYWSSTRPGAEGNEAKTKSAFIESVSAVLSHDNTGASPMSLLIRSPKRDLKLTAPSLERHELWFKSLSYLLGRPDGASNHLVEEPRLTTESSATENISHRQTTLNTKASDRSIPHVHDIVQYDSDDSDDLVNIRQCCDGKHDLSTLSRGSHHHHS